MEEVLLFLMNRRWTIYWISQMIGWGVFVIGNLLVAYLRNEINDVTYIASACLFLFGITLTHIYRYLIHSRNWNKLTIVALVPRVILASIGLGFILTTISTMLTNVLRGKFVFFNFHWLDFLNLVFNLGVLFLVWSTLYFAVINFRNWKNEEIKNLELKAAKTETELNAFRAQMNPHFMFNSLNSVRALIDDEPAKAKQAVTLLSGILRNNLLLGKKALVTLKEEMDLVEKYLSLERIRFEERLAVEYDLEPEALKCSLPPLMLQTIVENAVKHGISKRVDGGCIRIVARNQNDVLTISVLNSGHLNTEPNQQGIGIMNTKKRLDLMYEGKASFNIESGEDTVTASLTIPQHLNYAT